MPGRSRVLIRSKQRPLGQVYTLASLGDLEEFRKSRFHNEWIRAQRFGELIGLNGLRFGRRVAGLVRRVVRQTPERACLGIEVIGS